MIERLSVVKATKLRHRTGECTVSTVHIPADCESDKGSADSVPQCLFGWRERSSQSTTGSACYLKYKAGLPEVLPTGRYIVYHSIIVVVGSPGDEKTLLAIFASVFQSRRNV